MNLYQPTISGSLTVSGSVEIIGPFTMSGGSISGTSSFAANAGLLQGLDSTSFVGTGSFNSMSSSVSTRVSKIEGNYATTGSNIFTGAQTVCANITSTGTIIAQTLNVQQVTSSIVYSSGSNIFGCSLANTQQFTGSVLMTGSLTVTTAGTSPEFQVAVGGTTIGNALTDVHQVTGSLRITGSNALFNVGCVGIGNVSPAANLHVLTPSTGTGVIFRYTGGTNNPGLFVSTEESTKYVRLTASGTSVAGQLLQLGAEGTAGVVNVGVANVGIGTPTNLNQRLTIVDSNDAEALGVYRCFSAASDAGTYVRLGALNGSCVPTAGAAIFGALEGAKTSGYLSFFTYCGSTAFERMRINSNGQAGIGVTPSAWGNTIKALQVASFGSISSTGGIDTQISNNAYYDGTDWRYIAAQEAANYYMNRDTHVWRYRTAGGAGATITWCEAMRITNAGNVIVGDTADYSVRMHVAGVGATTSTGNGSSNIIMLLRDTTAGAINVGAGIGFAGNDGANTGVTFATINGRKENSTSGNYASYLAFQTRVDGGALTERLRITSGGQVGIKTTPNSGWGSAMSALEVGTGGVISNWTGANANMNIGVNYYDNGAGSQLRLYAAAVSTIGFNGDQITFNRAASSTAGSTITFCESMRISSTGDLTVNGNIYTSTGANRFIRLGSASAYYYDLQSVGDNFEIKEAGTTTRMKIFYPSGITCFSSTICAPCFATISDYRMKSNLRPIDGLSIIMNTKPYKFDYNYDCAPSFGMIAHELQEVVPEAVFGVKDGEVMQGVDYMKLLPISIKAIQEQQCIINQLRCENYVFKTCLGIA